MTANSFAVFYPHHIVYAIIQMHISNYVEETSVIFYYFR